MPKLKISSKVLLYFLAVSLLPLVFANYILVSSANNQLLRAASSKQQAVANDLSDRVNNYLDDKINSLRYQAQLYSSGEQSSKEIDQTLAVMFNQDKDIKNVAMLGVNGKAQVIFNEKGRVSKLTDESDSDAFKAVNFLSGKNYVSSVSYIDKNNPSITIAVPILKSDYSKNLSNLEGANFGTYSKPDDITGAVVAHYDISGLWRSVLSTKIGNGGYAYVVDGFGNLVAHPDAKFLADNQKLSKVQAVKAYIDGKFETSKTLSETGISVISTPKVIPNSGWAVIVEEPVPSIYAGINSYIQLAVVIGLIAVALSILMSVFFRKQLLEPIKKLSEGARRLGSGQFDLAIRLKSKDELQELADTFNKMGSNIKKLVSDLKSNNDNLSIEQAKLNNIIASVSDGIIALDKAGNIVSINPPAAALTGHPTDQILGRSLTEVFKWQRSGKLFQPELTRPGLYHYSELELSGRGHTAYLDLMVAVINRSSSDVAAIITIHDLTKSRELEFMKLDFVAIAAHELRTPLTVVRGYLDILNKNIIDQVTILDIENLQKAILGTNQLRDLINKLLNIARIERGEMEIFFEKLDITRLVRENVKQHKTTAAQKEQRISLQISADKPIYVPADPASLTEVLNNLIGNAIKFTPKGGEIHVNVWVNNDQVHVTVADDGPGVPSELRDKLFTKFYRAERTLISGTRGTGLGLFISRTIIELQHGRIGIMSGERKGSTFYFILPLYNAERHDKLISKKKQSGEIRGWFKKHSNS